MFSIIAPKLRLAKSTVVFVFFILVIGLSVQSTAAGIITVSGTGDGILSGDGQCTLREAIISANVDGAFNECEAGSGNDVIAFDTSGVFSEPRTISVGSQLLINSNIAIDGHGADQLAISGNDVTRVFYIMPGKIVSIEGLTIRDGNAGGDGADGLGGGIENGGTLTVIDSVITGNTAKTGGGGIDNLGFLSVANLINTTLSNNRTNGLGGGFLNTGTLSIEGGSISNNFAHSGGGIYQDAAGHATLKTCTISGNRTEKGEDVRAWGGSGSSGANGANDTQTGGGDGGNGAGIYNANEMIIESCTIKSNVTGSAGDARAEGGRGGNGLAGGGDGGVAEATTTGHGGDGAGIYNDASGSITINNSTLSDNRAGAAGFAFARGGDGGDNAGGGDGGFARAISDGRGGHGGAIYNAGQATFTNTTVSHNRVGGLGLDSITQGSDGGNGGGSGGDALTRSFSEPGRGGVYIGAGAVNAVSTIFANTLGTVGDLEGPITANFSLIEKTNGADISGADNLNVDPQLEALANNGGPTETHKLPCGSPAIDFGSNPLALTTDQRGSGFDRTFGLGTDIGAYEVQESCNTAPTAADDEFTTDEDTPLTSGNVLDNDTDGENDTLNADLVSGPSNGAVTLYPDGTFTYTPNSNFNGSDSFTYKANDGSLDSNVATVNITINAVNDPPTVAVAPGGSCSGTTVSGTMNLVLVDVDSQVGGLTISGVSSNTGLVANSRIVFGGSGAARTVTITPSPKKTGTAAITVTVSDGSATGTVQITVILGSDKNETLNGTSGADMIFSLGGKNTINGNAGNDLICGGNAVDMINGGAGDDTIDGGNGNDVLNGDAGNDIIRGGLGNDRLNGGADNDLLTGGMGADIFSGGAGADVATDITPSQGDTSDGSIP